MEKLDLYRLIYDTIYGTENNFGMIDAMDSYYNPCYADSLSVIKKELKILLKKEQL